MKNLYRIMAGLFLGFIGGYMSPVLLGWWRAMPMETAPDAVSIANTYIVFTTIIFVGFTVILGVASYVFTQQFSTTKEAQISDLIKELKERLATEEEFGIEFIDSVLENSDVKRHIDRKFQDKIVQLIVETKNGKKQAAAKAEEEFAILDEVHSKISGM